tara:strand:+ start:270 stop:671 length:402 start_codon:yes stop_codon:yes gene_type:complete
MFSADHWEDNLDPFSSEDKRTCTTCKQLLPISAFGKDACRTDGKDPRCLRCGARQKREMTAIRRIAPPKPIDNRCQCCGKVILGTLCLDHCHETMKFRGWICSACNIGIGKLGDTLQGTRNAYQYLSEFDKTL